MLILDYKLRTNQAQQAAIAEAIRTTQFVRNKALRLWMDGRGVDKNDLQALCAQVAHEFPFAARREFHGASGGSRPGVAGNCPLLQKLPREGAEQKRLPALGDKIIGRLNTKPLVGSWRWTGSGSHNTLGMGIGTVRLIGKKGYIETFPMAQIKRVRLLKRADGFYVQFAVQADRQIGHQPTGKQAGIDVGLKAFYTDSEGQQVENPR